MAGDKPAGISGGARPAASGRPAGAGAARRRPAAQQGGGQGGGGGPQGGALGGRETLRFYTDDAPGLKIGPTMVLLLSVIFVGSVVLLHIYGKVTGGGKPASA